MAAGYTLRELMEYMGHSSLQATERYVKLLPPLDETDPAERLNAYLKNGREMTERTRDSAGANPRPGEIVEMPPEERARRLTALWKRLMDPQTASTATRWRPSKARPTAVSNRPATL